MNMKRLSCNTVALYLICLTRVRSVRMSVGCDHVCVSVDRSDGTSAVFCWGDNTYGQCGYSPETHPRIDDLTRARALGPAVMSTSTISELHAGCLHTCAYSEEGGAVCWGRNDSIPNAPTPQWIGLLGCIDKKLMLGAYHTCVDIRRGWGRMRCWGVTDSVMEHLITPDSMCERPQSTSSLSTSGSATTSQSTTASISATMSVSMSTSVMSSDFSSSLPQTPAATTSTTATVETATISETKTISASTSASSSTAATITETQTSSASSTLTSIPSPTLTVTPSPTLTVTPSPTLTVTPSPTLTVTSTPHQRVNVTVEAGGYYTCVVYNNGSAKCWGLNAQGQLGNNGTQTATSPSQVGFIELNGKVSQITARERDACALFVNGSVKCWGSNSGGNLGYGHMRPVRTPASADFVPLHGEIRELTAGVQHVCALYRNGSVKCWGQNPEGQLGYVGLQNATSPEQVGFVPLGDTVFHIAGRGIHTCAVYQNGSVKCWGNNEFGQLGYGHLENVYAPASVGVVVLDGVVKQLTAGARFTCALFTDGRVKCWGRNQLGQLGLNIADLYVSLPSNVSVVSLGSPATFIAAGYDHTCAILLGGVVKCWGSNAAGQAGYGYTARIEPPMDILPMNGSVQRITGGAAHTCAVYLNESLKCWGLNNYGQLGYGHLFTIYSPLNASFVEL